MLLTAKQMALIEAYQKGKTSEEEQKELMELDAFYFEMSGEHIIPEKPKGLG